MLLIEQASQLARLPLGCVQREYPHKLDHLVHGDADVKPPRDLHPAFYGCFDWHSAVHAHWMLVRLLARFPSLPEGPAIRAVLDRHITPNNVAVEADYFRQPVRESFERMYGWAWLLQLATELHAWQGGERWARALQPLTDEIVERTMRFLPRQTYPIRTGVHPNTAFGLAFTLDHARTVGNRALEALVVERAHAYYANDTDAPARWEPSGDDFFSPSLLEADLMRRVLAPDDFARWLDGFFRGALPASLATPAHVSDRSDPKLAHLDGLNLSRAWCLRALSRAAGGSFAASLATSADAHAADGLANVTTGDYAGEHWLATFAVYLTTS